MSRFHILPEEPAVSAGRFPTWLHRKLPKGNALIQTGRILEMKRLPTVCEEARCPNLLECWSKNTATFLVMGKECTRSCGFCSIDHSKTPKALELDEPERVAESAIALGLQHVVITMVARDDLIDGGAAHLAAIVAQIRKASPTTTIELLTSDFEGNENALDLMLASRPDIFNHNVETVERLTPRVRHKATYARSLQVLAYARPKSRFVKSGLMVGLGEQKEEVEATLRDLKRVGVDIVTIGQYLQSDRRKLRVKTFVHPEQFKEYEEMGKAVGIAYVYSSPLVRSSYNAKEVFQQVL